jgi:hypothetical protein
LPLWRALDARSRHLLVADQGRTAADLFGLRACRRGGAQVTTTAILQRTCCIVIDTREPEHTAWSFSQNVTTRRAALTYGDYSFLGGEDRYAIERKTLDDPVVSRPVAIASWRAVLVGRSLISHA